jgi:hypothetical protein
MLRCDSCGAAMEYQTKVRGPQCAFCGGILKLEEQIDPLEQTEIHIPFTVDRARAEEAYRQWISRQGFFRPSNLASAARLESLQPLWWVGWAVDADALVTWTADSNAGALRAKWAPHAGELRSQFDELVIPATRGLSAAECALLIPTYKIESGVRETDHFGEEVVRERFELPRSFARAQIVGTIQRLAEARIKGQQLPGSRFRNFHAAIHLQGLVSRRLAFPAYVLAYRYRGQVYRTVISGQDPSCVIGEAPRSMAKLVLVIALTLLGLVALVIVVLQLCS